MEVIIQVPGSDNAGPESDILGLELMSKEIETLLEKKKANGIMFGSDFILSEIFISDWTLSLSQSQNDQTNPYLPNQTCQTKLIKPNIPNQTSKTKSTKPHLQN